MSTETIRRRFANGPARPRYLESHSDDVLAMMIMTLCAEISVLRERLDTHERLANASALPATSAVEQFVPDAAATSQRKNYRRQLIERVTRPLLDEQASGETP